MKRTPCGQNATYAARAPALPKRAAVLDAGNIIFRKKRSMRLSRHFLPVSREPPADAQIVSHKLMLLAGIIHHTAAGIYPGLPAGHPLLRKIEQIVREEQDRAGAIELLMPTVQSADLWRESGAMTPMALKCSASRTATSGRCCTARRQRK